MLRRYSVVSMILAACAATSCVSDVEDSKSLVEQGAGDDLGDIGTASDAVTITKFIPLRFIHLQSFCSSWTGCTVGHESYVNLKQAVDLANTIFADAGVKYWIQSMEAYPTSYFNGSDLTAEEDLTDAQRLTFQQVAAELRRMFPNLPTNAYPLDQKKGKNTWLDAATAHYGDPSVYHIFVHDETDETSSGTLFPWSGRSMHLVAERVVDETQSPDYVTSHLAHELSHAVGMTHPWDGFGVNPSTSQNWTYADYWDSVYCDLGSTAQFYTSRQNALANLCAGTVRAIFDDPNVPGGTDCTTTPSLTGVPQCIIEGVTYTVNNSNVLRGVARAESGVTHNPPTSWKYSTNVAGYKGSWGIDIRSPSFLSDAQLERIPSYLATNAVRYDYRFERPDGSAPLGSLQDCTNWCYGIGRLSLIPNLGTSTEDLVYWSNPSSGDLGFSFKASDVPVVGTNYRPVSGKFDSDYIDDVLWYDPNSTTARFWWGGWGGNVYGPGGDFTAESPLRYNYFPGTGFTVFTGDFNGDGRTDIFLYRPGSGEDYILWNNGNASFSQMSITVGGTYTPIVGNFDGVHGDDIFWYYAPGGYVHRWYSTGGTTFTPANFYYVDAGGPYVPVAGNFDGQYGDDIFWYKAGTGGDRVWYSLGGGSMSFTKLAGNDVVDTYTPIAGDFNGDGKSDIYWEADGATTDFIWSGQPQATQFLSNKASVKGSFRPVVGNFDGMWGDDIFWYRQ